MPPSDWIVAGGVAAFFVMPVFTLAAVVIAAVLTYNGVRSLVNRFRSKK